MNFTESKFTQNGTSELALQQSQLTLNQQVITQLHVTTSHMSVLLISSQNLCVIRLLADCGLSVKMPAGRLVVERWTLWIVVEVVQVHQSVLLAPDNQTIAQSRLGPKRN